MTRMTLHGEKLGAVPRSQDETFEFCEYQNCRFNNFNRLQVQHRWF